MSTRAQKPLQLTWSNATYGLDGPWNAVSVGVGTPSQLVDLIPGALEATVVLASGICSSSVWSSFNNIPCYSSEGGLYDNTSSSTSEWIYDITGLLTVGTYSGPGKAQLAALLDAVTVGGSRASNTVLSAITSAYELLPNGLQVPVAAGQLSLGGRYETAPSPATAASELTVISNRLFQDGQIPSDSVGLHIGSAAPNLPDGIPGSMFYGGYDQSRAIGPIIAQKITSSGTSFPINLSDVTLTTFDSRLTNSSDLLRANNDTIGSNLPVGMSPWNPYINLPSSTCDAMADALPVKLDSVTGYYLWNSDVDLGLVNGRSYFGFVFSSGGVSLTVNVPLVLLYLRLSQPIASADDVFYFPCVPYDEQNYRLGRAFMQAAFLGVNWNVSQTVESEALWYLAQAPGPNIGSSESPVQIPLDATQSLPSSSVTDWESTWSDFWAKYGSNNTSQVPPSGSGFSSSSGLTTGAEAGIGVGVAVAALALLGLASFLFVRRQRRRRANGELDATRDDSGQEHSDVPTTQVAGGVQDGRRGRAELGGQMSERPAEMDAIRTPVELDGRERIFELAGGTVRRS